MTFKLPENPQDVRTMLEERFGNPSAESMTPYERVNTTIQLKKPDRVPFDFWGVPETIAKLKKYLKVDIEEEMLRLLGTDCRIVWPKWIGPEPEVCEDGTFYSVWGSHRRRVTNEYSTYEEYASYPLANCKTVDEVYAYPKWAKTENFDWAGVPAIIDSFNTDVPRHIRYEVGGIFETAWGMYGLDHFLTDLFDRPEIPCAIMDTITDLFIANFENLMKVAKGKIELVYTYDDIAMQNGLLMSPRMWKKFIVPRHQRLNQVIKDHGVRIMYHSCGAIYPLIGELIDLLHIDILNPLQPRAKDMDMQKIKDEYGSRIAFHGGVDLQHTLPFGTQQEVVDEVTGLCKVLGKGGGYICTSAHYIQADVPAENILAMYLAPRNAE